MPAVTPPSWHRTPALDLPRERESLMRTGISEAAANAVSTVALVTERDRRCDGERPRLGESGTNASSAAATPPCTRSPVIHSLPGQLSQSSLGELSPSAAPYALLQPGWHLSPGQLPAQPAPLGSSVPQGYSRGARCLEAQNREGWGAARALRELSRWQQSLQGGLAYPAPGTAAGMPCPVTLRTGKVLSLWGQARGVSH